jgi:hypothetical protein
MWLPYTDISPACAETAASDPAKAVKPSFLKLIIFSPF